MSFTISPERWRRDVGIVAAGRALSLLGDEVAVIALILRASDAPNGAAMVTALLLAAMTPALVLAPLSGLLVDRLPTRALVAVTSLIQAALCASLVLVDQPMAVLALVFGLNAAQTVVGPAWQALVPRLAPGDRLPSALSTMQAAAAVAGMLGPAIGGLLVGVAGVPAALAVDALSFLALTAAALLIRGDRRPDPAGEQGSTSREAVAGFGHLLREPVLCGLVVLIGSFVVALGAVNVAEVFLVTDVLGATALMYGLMGTVFAVGSLGGALLAPRLASDTDGDDRYLLKRVLLACVALSASIGLLAVAPSLAVVAVASLAIGVSNACLNIWVQLIVVGRTPDELRGRVFAALQAVGNGALMVALAVGGAAIGLIGVRELVGVAAAVSVAVVAALAPLLLRRRQPSTSSSPTAIVPGVTTSA